MPVIVTNRHVVRGHETCEIALTAQKSDGTPDINRKLLVTIKDFSQWWIGHPDPNVDLVIIPIGSFINSLVEKGTPPFWVTCEDSTIPDANAWNNLSPLEDVLTVGFPGQVWDEKHNLPIFHRGITATPPNVDFNGRKEFLIDSAVWPGASGSPVFLYEHGAIIDDRKHNTQFGSRLMLLGIVYATAIQDVTGKLMVEEVPTTPTVHSGIPSNLGICIKASKIFDFQEVLIARGVKVPKDHKLRTSND